MLAICTRSLLSSHIKICLTTNAKITTTAQYSSKLLPKFISKRYKPKIAIINLQGTIEASYGKQKFGRDGKLNIEFLEDCIDKAFELNKLKAVCLLINSPGGSPSQSELIANKIIKLGEEKKVNVVSFVHDFAASGGYWLACAGNEIYVTENSLVGSIGVIISTFGLHEFIKRYDIERRVYASVENKSVFDPFVPEKERDVEILNRTLKQLHGNFVDYIKRRRGNRLYGTEEVLFNGDFWIGKEAVRMGLVDGINTVDRYIKEKFGTEVNIVKVNPIHKGRFPSLFGASVSPFENLLDELRIKFM